MTREIRIWIPGEPVPKARARTVRTKTGLTRSYTPAETKQYEARVKTIAQLEVNKCRWEIADDVYSVTLLIGRKYALKGGDLDNYAKAILDACNGILWIDDCRVIDLKVAFNSGTVGALIDVTASCRKAYAKTIKPPKSQ